MSKYLENALAKLRGELRIKFPGAGLRARIFENGERQTGLVVSGKDVPAEVYRVFECVMIDRKHPYVDFAWDDKNGKVFMRVGEAMTSRPDWYRTADQQIEIEASMDEYDREVEKSKRKLHAMISRIVPCQLAIDRKWSDKRKITFEVLLRNEHLARCGSDVRDLNVKLHGIIGGYLHDDGKDEFDLESSVHDYSIPEINQTGIAFINEVVLRGRKNFRNGLFAAFERCRKAFAAVGGK